MNTIKVNELSKGVIFKIKEIKEEKQLSLNELSTITNIDKAQLSKFFNCKINLSIPNVLKIIDKLGYEVKIVKK